MHFRFVAPFVGLSLLAACDAATIEGAGNGPPPAVRACVAALADKVDAKRTEIAVLKAQSVPEGDIVEMRVAGAEAPWRCVAGLDGKAQTLLYLGVS